jgi:hypothetical protein
VRRKIDWHVVPVLTFMYLLCFVRSPSQSGRARLTLPHRSTAPTLATRASPAWPTISSCTATASIGC